MTLLYEDRRFLQHRTGAHPESPQRLLAITGHLESQGLAAKCQKVTWSPATRQQIGRVHDPDYVESLTDYVNQGGGRIEVDTVVSSGSALAAELAAGAVCDAVQRVLAGEAKTALCLVRPPGHHALPSGAMGFCLFNNVAIAAAEAIHGAGLNRVLIVDFDVHHGNGTQEMFWQNERVGFFSIHRWPFYPGTGASSETGSGSGLGTTCNVPLEFGVYRQDFLEAFALRLGAFAKRMQPELILVSAGFDAHASDPVGSLGLESEDFGEIALVLKQLAATYCGGKMVSVLEGGYHPEKLAESVGIYLGELLAPPS